VSRCDRFESEALLRIERGLPLDAHFATCAECVAAREAYERLRVGIGSLGTEVEPPAGWHAEVRRRVAARGGRSPRRRPWLLVGGLGSLAAAAVAAFWLVRTPQQELAGASLRVDVRRSSAVQYRSVEARPGDRLALDADTGGAPHAELRVYRNDRELLLRCSTRAPCRREGGALRAELELDAEGSYQPLLLFGAVPPPAPTGDLGRDAAAAVAAGVEAEVGTLVVVR
jgi:hypothetical protein